MGRAQRQARYERDRSDREAREATRRANMEAGLEATAKKLGKLTSGQLAQKARVELARSESEIWAGASNAAATRAATYASLAVYEYMVETADGTSPAGAEAPRLRDRISAAFTAAPKPEV